MTAKAPDTTNTVLSATIPLEKYYESQVTFLKEETKHIRELMEKDAEMMRVKEATSAELVRVKEELKNQALDIRSKEVERRLEALNHEAERLALMVPRDMFTEVVDTLKKEIITLQLWKSNLEGRAAKSQMLAAISIIVSAVALGLKIFAK